KDGTACWVRFASSPIIDKTGFVGSFAMAMDITEHKRAEDALGILSDASVMLQRSLDYEQTLRGLSEFLVPRLADFCLLDLLDADSMDCTIASYGRSDREVRVQRQRHAVADQSTAYRNDPVLYGTKSVLVPVVD